MFTARFTRDYTSPAMSPQGLARHLTSPYFYVNLVDIVRRAGIKAVRGEYPWQEWVSSSEEVGSLMERIGASIRIEGTEYFHQMQGPCVFVSNHMSTLETFLLPAIIQPVRDVTFVVKNSLLKYPWLGPVLSTRDPIAIGRANPREDLAAVLEQGQKILESGRSVIIFPQGTRQTDVNPDHFGSLGIKLARRAGVPALPVALKTDAWGSGRFIKDMGWMRPDLPVHFRFGAPLAIAGNGKAEHAAVVDFIASNFRAWREQDCLEARKA